MKKIYLFVERIFEKVAMMVIRIFSNSITFMAALVLVIYWLSLQNFMHEPVRDSIRDFIISVTFLSLFIIQKWFNHFSLALHLKLNELVASHENANNKLIKSEEKSEEEMKELARIHEEIAKNPVNNMEPGFEQKRDV